MARRIMSWNKFHCKNRCDSAKKKKKESRLAKSGAQTMAQAESIYAEQNRAVVPMSLLFGRGALCVHYVAFVLTIFVTTRHWINQCAHSSGPWGDSHTVRWILCVCTKISQSREKGNQKKKKCLLKQRCLARSVWQAEHIPIAFVANDNPPHGAWWIRCETSNRLFVADDDAAVQLH